MTYQYFKGLFEGHEKYILTYQSWRPVFCEEVMVVVHGLGEHSGRYQNILEAFQNKGMAVYAYDQRGHGLSKGRRGDVSHFDVLAEDLGKFLKLVSIHENNRPIYLFGHSFGGLVCLQYLTQQFNKEGIRLAGVMLSNPLIQLCLEIPKWKSSLAGVVSKILPHLLFHNEVNLSKLSHDPKVGEAFKNDKLNHQKISARLYFEMLEAACDIKKNAGLIHEPTLMLLGGQDHTVDPKGGEEVFKGIQSAQKVLKTYPTFYHELVNEIGKEKVFVDMEQWMRSLR